MNNEFQMIQAAMGEILRCTGRDDKLAETVRLSGQEPVLPTRYRIGRAASAALGALGLAMADLRERQVGKRPDVAIDVRDATVSLRSATYVRLDGKPGSRDESVMGFYPVADGRWSFFHCNATYHQAALLKVLGVPADRKQVAAAALKWNAFELEQAVDLAGGCAPAVRTPEEWRALPNTQTLAKEPLLEIRKIADSAPIPLPTGSRPLSGIRGLDLTRVLAGPTCGRMLAEFGADILKFCSPRYPDAAVLELETSFRKRKQIMEINSGSGRDAFEALVRECDIFTQAYRQDALPALGFGPEQAAVLRPGIVYVSLNAFGYSGVWRNRRGFDTVVQSASGMAHFSARDGTPRLLPVSALDYLAGYLMVIGALTALVRRAEQGGSYEVRVSLARTEEWLTGMGVLGEEALALPEALPEDDLKRLLIDVPTPAGRLTRMRPVIKFSETMLNELPEWRESPEIGPHWLPR